MPTSLAIDLELTHTAEPVVAWRTWALTGRRDATELRLRPVAGRARPWAPGRPTEAVCRIRLHRAPHVDCTCGLHGTHEPEILRRTRSPGVLGRAALWGRVIEHELGFRAEFGYPQRLRLICFFCFLLHGITRCAADVVCSFGRGRLMPLCEEHHDGALRYGMIPVAVHDAGRVDQELRASYAVDVLAL